jgi:hypothetical protein
MAEQVNSVPRSFHWIGGWGVAPEAVLAAAAQCLPGATHSAVAPTARALDNIPACDLLVGWSLGAWRILEAAAHARPLPSRVILLAPFLAFGAEYGAGGRCSVTQVRSLQRWIKRDTLAALKDFSLRAGLGDGPSALPYALEDLQEGLDRLAGDATPELRRFAANGLPSGWTAVVGARDPLLDAGLVAKTLPGARIDTAAAHDLSTLITVLRNLVHEI